MSDWYLNDEAKHDARKRRSLAARAEWDALPEGARTPLRAMAVLTLHGFSVSFPFMGDWRWVCSSWETWGGGTYGHPCCTLAGNT